MVDGHATRGTCREEVSRVLRQGDGLTLQHEVRLGRPGSYGAVLLVEGELLGRGAWAVTVIPEIDRWTRSTTASLMRLINGLEWAKVEYCVMVGRRSMAIRPVEADEGNLWRCLVAGLKLRLAPTRWAGPGHHEPDEVISALRSALSYKPESDGPKGGQETMAGIRPEWETRSGSELIRDRDLVEFLKAYRGCSCQLCHVTLPTPSGRPYAEVHHIIPLAEGGADRPENMLILCPNCHRMMHIWKGTLSTYSPLREMQLKVDAH